MLMTNASNAYDHLLASIFDEDNREYDRNLTRIVLNFLKSKFYDLGMDCVKKSRPRAQRKKNRPFSIKECDIHDQQGPIYHFFKEVLTLTPDFSFIADELCLFDNWALCVPFLALSPSTLELVDNIHKNARTIFYHRDFHADTNVFKAKIRQETVSQRIRFQLLQKFHQIILQSLESSCYEKTRIGTAATQKRQQINIPFPTSPDTKEQIFARSVEYYIEDISRVRVDLVEDRISPRGYEARGLIQMVDILRNDAIQFGYDLFMRSKAMAPSHIKRAPTY